MCCARCEWREKKTIQPVNCALDALVQSDLLHLADYNKKKMKLSSWLYQLYWYRLHCSRWIGSIPPLFFRMAMAQKRMPPQIIVYDSNIKKQNKKVLKRLNSIYKIDFNPFYWLEILYIVVYCLIVLHYSVQWVLFVFNKVFHSNSESSEYHPTRFHG